MTGPTWGDLWRRLWRAIRPTPAASHCCGAPVQDSVRWMLHTGDRWWACTGCGQWCEQDGGPWLLRTRIVHTDY